MRVKCLRLDKDMNKGWRTGSTKFRLMGSRFREAVLLNCSEGAREGILDLSDRLRNISFIQGLASDLIQPIVRSCNYQTFDEITESALVEECYSV
jgi:hypothetical protein